jgi:hypothetical protein
VPVLTLAVRAPIRVVFSDHAVERAARFGVSFRDVGELVLDAHGRRRRNPGSADWRVGGRGLVVVYDWPVDDDAATARVVTVWLAG